MDRTPPDRPEDADLQVVPDALGDPDCRALLAALDAPMTVRELVAACDLSQTTTYRKLDRLADASLVAEEVEPRADGNHATRYRRDVEGVVVAVDGSEFGVTVVSDDAEPARGRRPMSGSRGSGRRVHGQLRC